MDKDYVFEMECGGYSGAVGWDLSLYPLEGSNSVPGIIILDNNP